MKIGFVHPNLNLKGGAEYVTIEIIQALEDDHEVELVSFTDPDAEELDDHYDTNISETGFSVRNPFYGSFFGRFENLFFKMRNHLIKRYASKNRGDYDLLISGMDEADFGEKGLQYVHFPESVNEQVFHETGEISTDLTKTDSGLIYSIYLELVQRCFKEDEKGVELNKTLCNSEFTRKVYQEVFQNEAEVLNPPVSMEIDEKKEFEDRENGFLCIGGINPSKGQKEVIEIIDQLQNEHDVHLHLIGSLNNSDYCEEIESMAEERDYVHLEGRISRKRMKDLIGSHRYGIHNFSGEHYGLAPAEMVKGGCITFVPSRGGPRDIVDNREELIFENKSEAVSRISDVLDSKQLQGELFEYVQDLDLNSPSDFRQRIKKVVEQMDT